MQFAKLRLAGFKSFVEATEFRIEPGLTGIVGSNGCGKSNLVEALRWVMGENRVKQMRGGEMDDVIFAGTSSRPARDVAEVALLLENDARKAPAAWNALGEIEIARRIERGQGSAYRIAGKESRARDVQTFFADIASGSHSPALVSQGRIAAIINAKPAERRQLLEEAAGITGLHARRHEAELKLRAADQNLARLDDVIATIDQQFQALKKQARQAARYRSLANLIRRAEAILLTLRWREADAAREAASARLAAAESAVADATGRVAATTTASAEATAGLPALRQAEAEAAARVTRLRLEGEQLDAAEARARAALEDCQRRIVQLEQDRLREEALAADAEAARGRLAAEAGALDAAEAEAGEFAREADAALSRARADVSGSEEEASRATEAVAAAEAERAQLARAEAELAERLARLMRQREEAEVERAALAAAALPPERLAEAIGQVQTADAAAGEARLRADAAEAARRAAQEAERDARDGLARAESAQGALAAEIAALRRVLDDHGTGDMFAAVIDQVRVAAGFEAALGAALGDDLAAPVDSTAPAHWRVVDSRADDPALPGGATPLAAHVAAPAALARRLAQIAVVDEADAPRLAGLLAVGQRLVTREGSLWRWDGFTVRAGAPSAAAARLAQRNRLQALAPLRAEAGAITEGARMQAAEARAAEADAARAEGAAREAVRDSTAALERARAEQARLERETAQTATAAAGLGERLDRIARDLADDEARQQSLAGRRERLPDVVALRAALTVFRSLLEEARGALAERQADAQRLAREAEARAARRAAIARDDAEWARRAEASAAQLAVIGERARAADAERERLDAEPGRIVAARAALLDRALEAEATRQGAADRLAAAETAAREAERALKLAEQALMETRETRARADAEDGHARQHRDEVAAAIREKLDCAPEETLAAGGVEAEDELPGLEQIQARVERLIKERDNVGPVNLRAEQEAAELEQQLATLNGEKADLVGAIAKLRQGIASLNREGRERLLAAFESVNRHFQELFVALFGGGRAHLALAQPPVEEPATPGTEPVEPVSKDPLDAGLEVMASPPGKKLQTLSLLSGGEQALTALALLFAVFLTTPAPICVLDEVDAPLDDANVDRFCKLLDHIVAKTATRFIVVTHHRMTMARMDRLFGVTMAERGVSQLVSVDLNEAERLRATA